MEEYCSVQLCLLLVILVLRSLVIDGEKYKVSERLVCGASQDDHLTFFVKISQSACIDECARRPSCKALDYSYRFKLCNLYTRDDITLVKGHCNYMKRTDITPEISCNNSCVDGEVCDVQTNECVISECKQLTLLNGTIRGNLNSIGSMKTYGCYNRFGHFPMPPSFSCLANGTWNATPSCEEPVNVALGKTVSMSTLYSSNSYAGRMVNGEKTGWWPCASTNFQPFPWSLVDLGENYLLFAFSVYNRRDCCSERLHDLTIHVGSSMDSLHLCIDYPHILDPVMQTLKPSEPCIGRYVKLQIYDEKNSMITICELEIYGHSFNGW